MELLASRHRVSLLAAFVIALCIQQGVAQSGVSASAPLQATTLSTVASAFDPNNTILTSWTSGNPCVSWTGVTCDSNFNVINITLTYAKLTGNISDALGSLTTLTTLNISNNWLVGPIPSSLGNLTNLTELDLSRNTLSGSIPDRFSNLASLQSLSVYQNSLSGDIPSGLGALTNLTTLDLGSNGFNNTIPDMFSGLKSLQHLSLQTNQLSGVLPASIAELSAIQEIVAAGNLLSGNLNSSLANLSTLKTLNLSYNAYNGGIPSAFAANTTSIQVLDLSYNQLSGDLPTWDANNTVLQELDLSGNSLTGTLVPALQSPPPNLKVLRLDHNSLRGAIPTEFGQMTKLEILSMSYNVLSGTLPDNLSACSNLTQLDLSYNLFSGNFPYSWANFTKLEQMIMDHNSISGELQTYDFSPAMKLVKLSMSNNQWTGTLPTFIPQVCLTFNFGNNFLSGEINGSVFTGQPNFTTVILEQNQLSGAIPYQFWNSSTFQYIALNNNSFTGIPADTNLSSIVLSNLGFILLGGNPVCNDTGELTGAISNGTYPSSLCTVPDTVNANPQWTPSNSTLSFPTSCTTTTCPGKQQLSIPVYAASQQCNCSEPLIITILLEECPFLVYTETFDILSEKLRTQIASKVGIVDFDQVWISGASQLNVKGAQLVTIQFFPATNSSSNVTMDRQIASKLIAIFQTQPDILGTKWGAVTYVSSMLTPDPTTEELEGEAGSSSSSGTSLQTYAIVLIVLASVALVATAMALLWFTVLKKPGRQDPFEAELTKQHVRHIRFQELIYATNNFDPAPGNLLGEGGFGLVYKGEADDGTQWAVKRAKPSDNRSMAFKEFQNEVRTISKLNHSNIVKLLGYCDERGERILVYEFCENGSLKSYMHPKSEKAANPPLTFEQRMDIAIGAAEGLRYMHEFSEQTHIHRDIKSDNILLDSKLQAKVADFGLLKDLPKGGSELDERSMRVAGTPGYVDPEYFLTFRVTPRSDVYSFGVVLLELITGKPPVIEDPTSVEHNARVGLASWATPYMRLKQLEAVVDPILLSKCPRETLEEVVAIACDCVERLSLNRPDMTEVANRLGSIKAKGNMLKRAELSSNSALTSPNDSERLLWNQFSSSAMMSTSTMKTGSSSAGQIGSLGDIGTAVLRRGR